MTTTPSQLELRAEAAAEAHKPDLPGRALLLLGLVVAAAAAASAPLALRLVGGEADPAWWTFLVLATAAATTQLFVTATPPNQNYHASIAFLVAGALLLPPELLPLLCVVHHVPEWLKERYPWYIQSFNTANLTLNTLAAWGVARLVLAGSGLTDAGNVRMALAGLAACVTFVGLNHVLLGLMLRLGRGHSFRTTGLFSPESLSNDLVLTGVGVVAAVFWTFNPWLVAIALGPLLVVHRSLRVPQLQAEARVDPKTGLFNARHFAGALSDELARSARFERPLALIMADLDLLREINNTHGHLAGDAVLSGVAEIFRAQLRDYDVPARFGGEEFSILLPDTPPDQALEIAERIRRTVAGTAFAVPTGRQPVRVTISIGVAGSPRDATDANELIHQADLAVYRAKLEGRNRVVGVGAPSLPADEGGGARLAAVAAGPEQVTLPPAPREEAPPRATGSRLLGLPGRYGAVVAGVGALGVLAGVLGLLLGSSTDAAGLLCLAALVAVGQGLAPGSPALPVTAIGCLAGAALFGPRAALVLAVAHCAMQWSASRPPLPRLVFGLATLSLSSLAAAAVLALGGSSRALTGVLAVVAGAAYLAVGAGLLSLLRTLEGHDRWWAGFRDRFARLLPHHLAYGLVAGAIAVAYSAVGLYALAVAAPLLLLARTAQAAYVREARQSARELRLAAETIQTQNASLEHAGELLRQRSTAAMESLSATVDARDSYTAGHSRRVQQLALELGRELGLSPAELDLLGHAALFHDIGKLAVPDSILLKPGKLTAEEWALMRRHAEEGARIVARLGFLDEAVPAIRHHHERWDGTGYPQALAGEEIPVAARIVHLADALDSMLTTRIYQNARPAQEALAELRRGSGSQFCPRCVAALERICRAGRLAGVLPDRPDDLAAAS